jgi:hypothetical protein
LDNARISCRTSASRSCGLGDTLIHVTDVTGSELCLLVTHFFGKTGTARFTSIEPGVRDGKGRKARAQYVAFGTGNGADATGSFAAVWLVVDQRFGRFQTTFVKTEVVIHPHPDLAAILFVLFARSVQDLDQCC